MNQIILNGTTKEELVAEILKGISEVLSNSRIKELEQTEWLTTKEVLSLLKVTHVTLWSYDKKGITKPQKIGNRKRYLKSDIVGIFKKKINK